VLIGWLAATASAAHAAPPASLPPGARRAAFVLVQQGGDIKPYDDRLARLAELLGAIHYLRELCLANDGQKWRDRMAALLQSEGGSPQRRARLSRAFNQGYRSYSRTYLSCTPSAQETIARFVAEGADLSETLARTAP
jgi:uncharacterized protein (TIGR02301 family)